MAFLAILEWKFHHPIVFGDTIHAISRIEILEPGRNGRRGEVTWYRRIFNQDGRLIQEGRTRTLVRGRTRQVPETRTNLADSLPVEE